MSNETPHIIWQDRHCLAVHKPAGLLTARDNEGDTNTLWHWVQELRRQQILQSTAEGVEPIKGYLAPLHFLDRPVSGVVLYALSHKAASRLSEQFRSHTMVKHYQATVLLKSNALPPVSGLVLKDWLLKDSKVNVTKAVKPKTPDAKLSELKILTVTKLAKLKGEMSGYDLFSVTVEPVTGRSHQIRVQLSSRGWVIWGDVKYGAKLGWAGKIALHAFQLQFMHPTLKESMRVQDPLPPYWSIFS